QLPGHQERDPRGRAVGAEQSLRAHRRRVCPGAPGGGMKRPLAELAGTGRYVPPKVLTNADLEKMVDTTDEWIMERTGIRERHIASPDETIACMADQACRQVLAAAGVSVEEVDGIVVGTASWDRLLPSQACDLQKQLGAVNAAAFDVSAACTSFMYGI